MHAQDVTGGMTRVRSGLLGRIMAATGVRGVLNAVGLRQYLATPLTLSDGDHAADQCDEHGFARVSLASGVDVPAQATQVVKKVPAAIQVLKNTGGKLHTLDARLLSSATASRFLTLHDANLATEPSEVNRIYTLTELDAGVEQARTLRLTFMNGIKVALSSTETTYTGTTDAWLTCLADVE